MESNALLAHHADCGKFKNPDGVILCDPLQLVVLNYTISSVGVVHR